nr:hypothetical protein [Anaerolineae bacterium]
MRLTEILLVVVIVLQALAQALMTLTIYNHAGEKTSSLKVFIPWIRKGALCFLLGFIHEKDDFTPIYRPLMAWATDNQSFLLEINLGSFSIAFCFSTRYPFFTIIASSVNEKLF